MLDYVTKRGDDSVPGAPAKSLMPGNRPSVAFLNRCYWPDCEATGQLLEELATHLSGQFDVTVVAGQPNHGADDPDYVRRGTQMRNGVRIERLSHTKFHKASITGRLTNLASFTWKARQWGRRAQAHDILVTETDPFFLPLVAAPLAKRWGAKYVAYLQDVYPDIGVQLDIKRESMATRWLRERLRQSYLQADRIVVLDEDMQERLMRWGIPEEKFRIIPNWIDTNLVRPRCENNRLRAEWGLEDRFVVMHSGNMGLTQRLDNLVRAVAQPDWPAEAILLLVGGGARRDELEQLSNQLGVQERVRFLPYQPKERLGESLSSADVQIISMDAAIRGCMAPSKLYGILAAGVPTLGLVPRGGSVARIIEREELGYCVQPNDPRAVVAAVVQAMSDRGGKLQEYGANARRLAVKEYDREVSCRLFAELLEDLVEQPTLAPHSTLIPEPHLSLTDSSV